MQSCLTIQKVVLVSIAAVAVAWSALDVPDFAGLHAADKESLQAGAGTKSDSKVKVTAAATPEKPGADGKQVVKVVLSIEDGWHIYANPVGLEDLEGAKTTLVISSKVKPQEVKIEYPAGELMKDAVTGDYKVYKDKVEIRAVVVRGQGDTGPLQAAVTFQACCHIKNKEKCLVPATVKVTVP